MKKLVKIAPIEFENQSRDIRELEIAQQVGFEIEIVAKGEVNTTKTNQGFLIHEITTRPLKKFENLKVSNRIVSLFIWARYVKKLQANCLSCHDLIGLMIGWLSTIGKTNKPILVYDSHEFELGRNTEGRRKWLGTKLIYVLESFLIKRAQYVIVVNESIGSELKSCYKLKNPPIVVRNIPNYWEIDMKERIRIRNMFNEKLKLSENSKLIMYHGAIVGGRGIENILEAIKELEDVGLILLGDAEKNYKNALEKIISKLEISERIYFHEAVSMDRLSDFVGSVDIGMVMIPPITKSYYLSLPNKLFENIQAIVPVLASDLPEISKIVKQYGIGELVNPDDVNELVAKLKNLKDNKAQLERYKTNLREAKEILCWENESMVLKKMYKEIKYILESENARKIV